MADQEVPLTSAQAHANASKASSSVDLAASPAPAPTPAADEGADKDKPAGTSPDAPTPAADDPDRDEDAGTSPAVTDGADPDEDDDDDDGELPEDVRKTVEGYKSPSAIAKALHETKRHSLGQHEQIQTKDARIKELEAKLAAPAAPAAGTADSTAAPAADVKARPDPPEVTPHRRAVADLPDQFDKAEADLKACVTERETTEQAQAKLDVKIEFLEDEAKTADEYRKDQITEQVSKLRGEKDRTESKLETLRLREQRLDNERLDLHETYHASKRVLSSFEDRRKAADEVSRKAAEDFPKAEAAARTAVQASITKAAEAHKIPTKLREKFGVALLKAANGHPETIRDLDAFFLEEGKLHAELIEHVRAESAGNYGDQKRRDADQPAPSGDRAVAAPTKPSSMLSSKDAHRAALAGSRRVPLA